MALGRPAIPTPRELQLRAVQQSIDQIRERFSGVETAIRALQDLVGSNQTIEAIDQLRQQVAALSKKVAALDTSESIALINALVVQPNGLVVLKDGELITRILQAGEGIVILYPDGSVSDPLIKLTFAPVDPLPLARSDDGPLWPDDAFDEGNLG